ncbi:hypothetical protein ABZZ16_07100 [Streptomyces sp. NPDC006386]|uniref:hypothetical protein n=1 Tax=Streptomyces sp. NPDC006386 TaxID=3156762 RepID=UPI0033B26173
MTKTSDNSGTAVSVLTESLDDYGPMVALAIRRPDLALTPVLRHPASSLPDPGPAVTMHEFLRDAAPETVELWRHFQVLWHRWAAPLDSFHPVRWYLTAVTDGTHRAVHRSVDAQLQQLGRVREERLAAMARLLGAHTPDAGEGAVLGWGTPEWSLPGMLLAARTGRPYLWEPTAAEALRAAGQWPGPLTLSFPHDEVTVEQIAQLATSRSWTARGRLADGLALATRPVGFLTATSVEVLSSVVGRQLTLELPLTATTTSVFTGLDTDPEVGPDSFLLNRERSAVGYLEAMGGVNALFLSGHSREDLFHLGPDALCGRSAQNVPFAPGSRLPACVHDGRCVKDGEVLPAHALTAPVAFFNSCNVMRLGGDGAFDPHFTLPFTYQEGSGVAAVGSRRTRFGDDNVELLLAERLLRTGRSVGEVVRLVNNAIPLWGREAPDYLVLGDQQFTPFAPGADRAQVATRATDGQAVEVLFTDVESELLELRLPSPGPDPSVRVLDAVGPDGQPCDIDLRTAIALEEDGSARLFVFSWQTLRLNSLSLRVEPVRPHQDLVQDLGRVLTNATAYRRLLRTYLPGFDNTEQELRARATALTRRRAESRTAPRALREADAAADDLRATVARLDEALCDHLVGRIGSGAFVWLEQFESVDGTFQLTRHLPPTVCPYCRARVVLREYRHDYHPQAAREFALCSTCGNVWDVAGGVHPPIALGEDTARRGSEHAQGVLITNNQDRPLRGAVGLRLYQADQHGVSVTPGAQVVEVPPRSSREYWFTLKLPDGVPAHMEFLRGFFVSNLDVSVFQRNLWIKPAHDDDADRPRQTPPPLTVWPPTGTVLSEVMTRRHP